MAEQILVFDEHSPDRSTPMDRSLFYDEEFSRDPSFSPTRGVEIINVILVNLHGDILVQKRSPEKRHNPNLLDKTIGGHIQAGDSPDYTVLVETVQELLTPSIVLRTDDDFHKTLELLKDYLETIAVIKYIDSQVLNLAKVVDDKTHQVLNKVHTYFGVYEGSTKPVDRESLGILYYPMDVLRSEISSNSHAYTDDLKVYLDIYEKPLAQFVELSSSARTDPPGY